jgi:hypothetical protein
MSRWAIVLVVIVAAIVAASVGYQIGVSRGLALSGQLASAPANLVVPYGWYRPWGFGFGFLFPLFFFGFWFVVIRGLLWGGPWRRGWHQAGPYDVPSRFDEWHRRAHDRMNAESTPPASA